VPDVPQEKEWFNCQIQAKINHLHGNVKTYGWSAAKIASKARQTVMKKFTQMEAKAAAAKELVQELQQNPEKLAQALNKKLKEKEITVNIKIEELDGVFIDEVPSLPSSVDVSPQRSQGASLDSIDE
jgi:hypothetical protein